MRVWVKPTNLHVYFALLSILGAVNVVKAYADTGLPHSKEPSNEAKAGVRDCTQVSLGIC